MLTNATMFIKRVGGEEGKNLLPMMINCNESHQSCLQQNEYRNEYSVLAFLKGQGVKMKIEKKK